MIDFLKRVKMEFLLSSVMCIILGLVLILWGDKTLLMLGTVIGAILTITGAVNLISFLITNMENKGSAILGMIILLMGIWVLIDPGVVARIVPIVIGVIMIFHGIKAITVALEAKEYGDSTWGFSIALASVSLVFGVICILNAFELMTLVTTVIGIALIYNGVSNIFISVRSTKAEKAYRVEHETIDVEFKN